MPNSVKHLSYYQTGGEVGALFEPENKNQLQESCREIKNKNLPFYVLGGGTNSLLLDNYYPGAVISLGKMTGIKVIDTSLICEAGASNTAISEFAFANNLEGAAWMNYLPGQIGGTTRMNARCYGGEISQIVDSIKTINENGEEEVFSGGEKTFQGYKNTIFMTRPDIIYEVQLNLMPVSSTVEIRKKMDFCFSDRSAKSQFTFPSCGCVFKNDYEVGISSGVLLEKAGAKQLKYNNAAVNSHHANFIFNLGGSTSEAILQVSFLMREAVYLEFGVWLQYEMEVLGTLTGETKERFFLQRPMRPSQKLEQLKQQWKKI